MRKLIFFITYIFILAAPLQLIASSGGPPDNLAGNPPNRANCTQCHSSFGLNSGGGSLGLADFPEEYAIGETYRITVQLSDRDARRWGFELTAIDEENDRAGNLEVVNGNQTLISSRNNRPQYLKQRSAGTFRNQRDAAEWEFDWTAPDEDIGEIWFYFTGNAANNNGNTAGDRIYASNVSMTAEEPPPPPPDPDVFELTLNEGWNFVSSIVTPDTTDITHIFAEVIEAGNLSIIRNSAGEFFDAANGEGELATWESGQAYQVKMNQDAMVTFSGTFVDTNSVYMLNEGWNWLPYPRMDESHPIEAFAEFAETIEFVKDNSGIFWSAGDSLNYIPMIMPGSAVMVMVNAETEFTWAVPVGEADQPMDLMPTEHFASPMNSGNNMSFLVTMWEEIEMAEGDELSLMNGEGEVFASAVMHGGSLPLIVWGDDDTTPEVVDGFMADSTLHFVYYNSELDEEVIAYAFSEEGDSMLTYEDNGFTRITVGIVIDGISDGREAFRNESFEIVSLYPNPFNQSTELEFRIISSSIVKVNLWSIEGRLIKELRSGFYSTGLHSVSINAKDFAAGMYFIEVKAGSTHKFKRLVLLP